jgi:hypothetical protein
MQTELEQVRRQLREYEALVLKLYPYVTFPSDNPEVKPIAAELEATFRRIPYR